MHDKRREKDFNKKRPQRFTLQEGKSGFRPAKKREEDPKVEKAKPANDDSIRLNRYIANSGVCSRRDADALIAKGEITVNGKVVTEMGMRVGKSDKVVYNGKTLNPENRVYILLNKPRNTVSTSSDPEGRRTVIDIVANACEERIYPVGRLDRNTTGVLLLTNDGDLSKKLTHPSYEIKKIYHVKLSTPLSKNHFDDLRGGIELEDGFMKVDAISYVDSENKKEIGVEIHSGKNRIVRRLFEHLGYEVIYLDRVYFSGLTKAAVPRGKWRFLTEKEVTMLKAGILK